MRCVLGVCLPGESASVPPGSTGAVASNHDGGVRRSRLPAERRAAVQRGERHTGESVSPTVSPTPHF